LDTENVFVKYLPSEMNDAGLRELFIACGEIVSAKVMMDSTSGSSFGFGFVRFKSPEDALKATQMAGLRIANKTLLCKLSAPSIYPQTSTNLYVKPLPVDLTEENFIELFSAFGIIQTAKILVDKSTGKSKEIGFVKFEEQESATTAVEKMNGFKINTNATGLIVKYAESNTQRATRQAGRQASPNRSSPSSPTNYPNSPYHEVTTPYFDAASPYEGSSMPVSVPMVPYYTSMPYYGEYHPAVYGCYFPIVPYPSMPYYGNYYPAVYSHYGGCN